MGHLKPRQTAAFYNYDLGSCATAAARASAQEIVPVLCKVLSPRSVVDFGCGLGDWLLEFRQAGVADVLALDGPWVPKDKLVIPKELFRAVDLTTPVVLERRFDVAICLEVAEHLEAAHADTLIASLTNASDVVCFAAGIPGQGGYGHVNEQFQDYWVGKFRLHGFQPVDLVRPRVWLNSRISVWYRQNLLLFLSQSALSRTGLKETPALYSCVHPELYEKIRDPKNYSLKTIFKLLPYYCLRFIKVRLGIK